MDNEYIELLLIPAIIALASTITFLWRQISKHYAKVEKKLDDCEEHHELTKQQLIDLTAKVGKLEGRQQGVEHLAKSVIEELNKKQ